MFDPIRVMVVDDSALVRKIITDMLESDPAIEVVGSANNGKSAIFKNQTLNPDVITMDIEMPVMDGLTALREIIDKNPKPVIMMSVLTQHGAEETFKALDYGAVDFIPKPSSVLSLSVDDIRDLLISKVKSVYKSKIFQKRSTGPREGAQRLHLVKKKGKIDGRAAHSSKIIGIGTSTGGPSALISIFRRFPSEFPAPVLVVQHMPEGFTKAFAERLNSISTLQVKEASDRDRVLPGCGYIAPGNHHIKLEEDREGKMIRVFEGDKVSGHRPSIDVLFDSLAFRSRADAIAILMTGMGRDGADGIKKIKDAGGYTLAQNEETSVVYGMNRVAVEIGAIQEIVPLDDILGKIVESV